MITDRIDPPELLKIPEIVNVSIATGSRVIHISGQTAVDVEGKVVGSTHLEQSRHRVPQRLDRARRSWCNARRCRQVQHLRGRLQLGRARGAAGCRQGSLRRSVSTHREHARRRGVALASRSLGRGGRRRRRLSSHHRFPLTARRRTRPTGRRRLLGRSARRRAWRARGRGWVRSRAGARSPCAAAPRSKLWPSRYTYARRRP